MLKFAIAQTFKSNVSDSVEFTDPWGQDLRLTVLRKGSRQHRRYERKAQSDNPVLVRVFNAMTRAGLKRSRQAQSANPEEARRFNLEQLMDELEREADKLELTGEEVLKMLEARREEAVALVTGWAGNGILDADTKKPVPFTPENVRLLLEQDELLPEGQPFAGLELGAALVELIHQAAEGQDVSREAYLIDAGKDSGGTSAGSSEPGLTMPATAEA